jgi:VanZ family protein
MRYEYIMFYLSGRFSRSDWLANVLLFMPLGFVWMGVTWPGRRFLPAAARALAIWVVAVLFQMALEFGQIYLPGRSVSHQDVIAAMQGAALGIALWWVAAPRVLARIERWNELRNAEGLAGWALGPYAIALTVYSMLPLDLALSPSKLHEKWVRGKILLVPFQGWTAHPLDTALSVVGEAALWLPFAALWVLSGRGGRVVAWCVTVLLAICVEGLQLFALSRTSDVTDVVSAALGGVLGAALGLWLRPHMPGAAVGVEREGRRSRPALVALVFFFAWGFVVLIALWRPFDFVFDPDTYETQIGTLISLPFRSYWSGNFFDALADLLRNAFYFAPLGAALGIACGRLRHGRTRGSCGALAVGVVAGVGLFLEIGQVFLPTRVPDSTDVVLAALSGAAGLAVARAVGRRVERS